MIAMEGIGVGDADLPSAAGFASRLGIGLLRRRGCCSCRGWTASRKKGNESEHQDRGEYPADGADHSAIMRANPKGRLNSG